MSDVVAIFENRERAERAVDALEARGFDSDRIGYVDRFRDETGEIVTDPDAAQRHQSRREDTSEPDGDDEPIEGETEKGVTGGAVGGMAVGAGAAFLTTAGIFAVPGLGPFLAAGTLIGTLTATGFGAASGAAIGGVAGAILGAGDDDDDRHEHYDHETSRHYREGIREGRAMLTVDVRDRDRDEAVAALRDAGAQRVDVYDDDGWR